MRRWEFSDEWEELGNGLDVNQFDDIQIIFRDSSSSEYHFLPYYQDKFEEITEPEILLNDTKLCDLKDATNNKIGKEREFANGLLHMAQTKQMGDFVSNVDKRTKLIREMLNDQKTLLCSACDYLANNYSLYPYTNYNLVDAVTIAENKAFESKVREIVQAECVPNGKKVRAKGFSPAMWDGTSETDSAGRYIKWIPAKKHHFFSPAVTYVISTTPFDKEHTYIASKNSI